ncbi:TPA: hypothetical protein HA265_07920, partial [Candidatus Woesearchaeota archaeon]|nr:hypothetical protein [Candidatus Woesearchaeota archaeon]
MIIGVAGVWLSSELVIHASQVIAHRLKISESFIGLTVLSIGTTLPELGTHIMSSIAILQGKNLSDIAVSTNIGSNIVQITAILGIVALFLKVKAHKEFLDKDYVVMLGAIVLLFILGLDGRYNRLDRFFLVMLYIVYLAYLGKTEHFVEKIEHNYKKGKVILLTLSIPFGIALLLGSAQLAIMNADRIATLLQVKDTLIGALVLGIGTALPELAAALVAIKRGSTEMSI